mgnify:CR=1 FL=1
MLIRTFAAALLATAVAAPALAAPKAAPLPHDQALEILKKRFDKMDQDVLAAAWRDVAAAHAKDIRVTVPSLDHSQKVSLEAKLLDTKDSLSSFDGLYTDEFVK